MGFATQVPNSISTLLLIDIGETFGSHVGMMGQITTTSSAVAMVVALAMGVLSVRYMHRTLLLTGLLFFSLSAIGCYLAPNYTIMLITFAIGGAGGARAHVSCPLCGKLSHVSSFHPENLGNDIEFVDMRSLGRGRGFQVTGRYSALGDPELMGRISTRLHELQRLIEGKEPLLDEENPRLLDAVEELEDEVRSLSEKLKKANQMIIKYEDTAEEEKDGYEELLSLVNNALSDVYDEEFDDIDSAIRALVDEYDDLLEETDDEG